MGKVHHFRWLMVGNFFVANAYEGCGHAHRTAATARRAHRSLVDAVDHGSRYRVYRVVSKRPFRARPA